MCIDATFELEVSYSLKKTNRVDRLQHGPVSFENRSSEDTGLSTFVKTVV